MKHQWPRRAGRTQPRSRGFTLVELLIALAVVAILSAIAWPSYGAILNRAHRQDARLSLLAVQHAQELHYQRHHAYSGRLPGAISDGGLGLNERSQMGGYLLSIRLQDDGQGYLAVARPAPHGRQTRDRACTRFTLDEKGQHGAADADGADSTAACWR